MAVFLKATIPVTPAMHHIRMKSEWKYKGFESGLIHVYDEYVQFPTKFILNETPLSIPQTHVT